MKYLVWVSVEVKILQEASSKLTEQEVVCVIDGPQAPVCVVVGTSACTEWTHWEREGRGSGRGREGWEWKTGGFIVFHIFALENNVKNKKICANRIFFRSLSTAMSGSSLVQKGAVCQWWLSWVKQVRPGMLHVSLFWSLLRNLRSFFLRFCSFCSHWVFCLDGTLIRKTKRFKRVRQGNEKP